MDHDRPLACAVGCLVLQFETLRQVEVQLDGGHLPGPAECVLCLDGDFRSVECCSTRVRYQLQTGSRSNLGKSAGGFLPSGIVTNELFFVLGREFQVEVVQAVILEQAQDEVQRGGELVLHLFAGAVDVGVVLCHATDAGQTVHNPPGLFVAVHRAEFEEAQRKFAVGPAPVSGRSGCAWGQFIGFR